MIQRVTSHKIANVLLEKVHQFLLFFLPMLLIFMVAGSIHFYSDYEVRRNAIEESEQLHIQLAQKSVSGDISRIVSDLLFLSEHINNQLLSRGLRESHWQQEIIDLFHSFATNKRIYDQLRYIDHQGMEKIRVNYHQGTSIAISNDALQDKSARYYVQQGLKLRAGEVYLSPMDLNIESGKIELPHKPVIRFVTPVLSANGTTEGLIVLNYLGDELIQGFRQAVTAISDRTHLLNNDSYWLSHSNPLQEWGFMFNNHSTFEHAFPEVWRQIQHHGNGRWINHKGLFSFATINPLQIARSRTGITQQQINPQAEEAEYRWHIITHLPTLELESTPLGFLKQNRVLYSAILIFIATLSWILSHNSLRRKEFELHRANELRFRDTLEEIYLAALTLSPDGTVLFCNNYLLQLLRKRREEVVGKNWFHHFSADSKESNPRSLLDDALSEDELQSRYLESHIIDFRGEQRLISWTSSVVFDDQEQIESITYIGQDITDQHQTREELTKLARAAEQSPAVIMITDTSGAIEYVNPKFTELTGYGQDEAIGNNPRILKSGATTREEYRHLWQTISSGQEWRGILHNKKRGGDLYWESALISPIRNEDGRITHYLSVKEDITAQKALETEIEQRKKELDQAHTLAVVGRMAGMVAHDLRNPLSSIKMGLQILSKKQGGDPEEIELHQIGLEQIRYMESILEGLLAYSRPDELELSWVSLDKLIDTSVSSLQNQISEHHIEIGTDYPPGLPTLQVDKVKIRRVLTNLLSNAIDAIEEADPEQRTISIQVTTGLEQGGPVLRLEIEDNGTGFDAEQQANLFEPFFTTRAKGTGLGLAIVKRIIDQHHGNIHFDSRPGAGTTVVITLPVHHSEESTAPLESPQESFIQISPS